MRLLGIFLAVFIVSLSSMYAGFGFFALTNHGANFMITGIMFIAFFIYSLLLGILCLGGLGSILKKTAIIILIFDFFACFIYIIALLKTFIPMKGG